MRRARSKRFARLSDALPALLRRLNLDRVVEAQQAVALWPEAVGEKVAEHARAVSVDGTVLLVAVDSHAWLTQLAYLKPELLRRLRKRTRKPLVTNLRLVLASRPQKKTPDCP